MRMIASAIAAGLLVGGSTTVAAQSSTHVMQTVKDAQWGPAPPVLPAGAQIAVLAGDPTKAVPYTIRLKFPANYVIPAHSHPTDEHIVVVSGSVTFGMGDKVSKSSTATTTLGAGSFALMPAAMNHFAFTGGGEATIVLYGQGPVDFKYVNPADDPRRAQAHTK